MPQLASPATRDRILAYLSEHATASSADLAQAWGLTRADIRYHLAALFDEGLIELAPRPAGPASVRGRPVQSYRLAAQARPNNLVGLAAALLQALLSGLDEAARPAALRAAGPLLAAELAPGFTPPANLTRRLTQAVDFLNRAHYRARWEAAAQGPRLLLRACPYAALLERHPHICQLDHAMLEHLLQTPLRHTTRLDPLTGKPPFCVFLIN